MKTTPFIQIEQPLVLQSLIAFFTDSMSHFPEFM